MKQFPILGSKPQEFLPLELLNEEWAMKIHDQTLKRLAQRGGLCPKEIICNINKLSAKEMYDLDKEFVETIIETLRIKCYDE